MSAADVLREARNSLFEDGWHQGSMWGEHGSACSMGAMYFAGCVKQSDEFAYRYALCYFVEAIDTAAIGEWNDAPERTFDDVVAAFDKAEKLAEQGETMIPLARFGIIA